MIASTIHAVFRPEIFFLKCGPLAWIKKRTHNSTVRLRSVCAGCPTNESLPSPIPDCSYFFTSFHDSFSTSAPYGGTTVNEDGSIPKLRMYFLFPHAQHNLLSWNNETKGERVQDIESHQPFLRFPPYFVIFDYQLPYWGWERPKCWTIWRRLSSCKGHLQ